MPFAAEYEAVYQAIKAALNAANIRPVRADEIPRGGPFVENVLNAIEQAGIVIGVTSGANPNVSYELGFAQHLSKEAILLTDNPADIPADLRHINHLTYSPTDLGALETELGRWIANSQFLSVETSRRAMSPILRRGDVFETVVDGTFYLQRVRPTPSKTEIRGYLRQKTSMPQRLLYLTEEGQSTYLQLCEDPSYWYYRETSQYIVDNATQLVDSIVAHCKSSEVDFISLGPGNGHKDAVFLDEFSRRARQLRYTYYYPYDVSGGLLLEAMRNILARELPLERLRVKAIEADIAYLAEFKRVFDYRSEPNVYSLLGGLANMASEVELLTLLRRLMNDGDVLLIEARKRADAKVRAALGRIDLNRRLDLAPLRYIGAKVDPATVTYGEVPSTSTIPETRTIAALVPRLEIDDRGYEDVNLFAVHYYEPTALKRVLEGIGFRLLSGEELENSLFYACVRA